VSIQDVVQAYLAEGFLQSSDEFSVAHRQQVDGVFALVTGVSFGEPHLRIEFGHGGRAFPDELRDAHREGKPDQVPDVVDPDTDLDRASIVIAVNACAWTTAARCNA